MSVLTYLVAQLRKMRWTSEATPTRWYLRTMGGRFSTYYASGSKGELSRLCDLYGSDKGTTGRTKRYRWEAHTYADYYERRLGVGRESVSLVFECGIGSTRPDIPTSMGAGGSPGASLRVWRDYFEKAEVFGADIDRNVLFEEDRICT